MTSTLETTAVHTPHAFIPQRQSRGAAAARLLGKIPTWLTIAFLILVTAYPLFWMFINSLKSNSDFLNNPSYTFPEEWRWDNYANAWETGNLSTTVMNSVIVTVPSLVFIVLFGTAAGFALEVLVFRGRGGILLLFLAGIMIPGQMIILPLFNTFFELGINGSHLPMILIYIAGGLPLTVFMMATYFRAIPREIFEAATIDGASMIRAFFSIGFPMMRNAILTVAIVQFFLIWNDLLIALVFGGKRSLNTIQVGLLNFSGEYGAINYGPLFAAICITVFGILFLYLFLNQRIMKGLAAGAVKG
ncbi:carbohydrate ABC transporter permease [Microbacterium sp. EYE_5]|uniref:carbohydrate ABC transporter permease n=1 Tax=unclassified Microbacterium TaxID=2609290 RepID=UPI002002BC2E|nr:MULTISPECIES: carbohydrate ABC transporter permease [unclassified Microbacterium]MCK6079164.1 carbohydrate ABC transporter permease [Microbacterium sp. EYE_382]MCK6084434.1 carbohydrate ABC transporter permease [Microbacterium sp. EYE_384]MCK6123337.1 carbohydrate ABC transporter permease [Microbacterium sp. EYE_80]MCK6125198.1 carbohydrate ABC transporter permease [Microbacterium sp. EYE_79]MCK6140118.1 carbohydrate ABC transporter permease [Microbacterium sp. EYE_39]